MEMRELEKKIAYLEFVNDQLMSEIYHVDQLLKDFGFADGLSTIKSAIQEVSEDDSGEE